MIKKDKINEVSSLGDPENIDVVVNNIYNEIKKKTLKKAYLYKIDKKNIIEGEFYLDREINPCKWLGITNSVKYVIILTDDKTSIEASLSNGDDTAYIEINDDKRIIEGTVINIIINIGRHINDKVYYDGINLLMKELKSKIRHELKHAYDELTRRNLIKIDPDEIADGYTYENFRNYTYAYNELITIYNNTVSRLKKPLSKEDKECINFLYMLYSSCYIESYAFISGFYQNLIDDLENAGRLKDIHKYKEYDVYVRNLEFLRNFNGDILFDLFNSIIQLLYGKGCSNENTFRRKLRLKNEKIIKKMNKIYSHVYTEGKYITSDPKITLEEAHLIYLNPDLNDDMTKPFHMEYKGKLVEMTVPKIYKSKEYGYVTRLEKFFSDHTQE